MNKSDPESIILLNEKQAFFICRLNPQIQNFKQIIQECNAYSESLWKNQQLSAQIFKLNEVVSVDHIKIIISRVLNVFQREINISNHPNIEFLLYLSGQRQIKRALEIAGIIPQNDPLEMGFTVFGNQANLQPELPKIREFLSKYNIEPIPSRSKVELSQLLQKHSSLENFIRILHNYNYNTLENSSFQDLIDQFPESILEQIFIDIVNEQMVRVQMSNLKGEK